MFDSWEGSTSFYKNIVFCNEMIFSFAYMSIWPIFSYMFSIRFPYMSPFTLVSFQLFFGVSNLTEDWKGCPASLMWALQQEQGKDWSGKVPAYGYSRRRPNANHAPNQFSNQICHHIFLSKENFKFRNLKFLEVGAGRLETEHLNPSSVLNWFWPLADGIAIEFI